jgi:hypothetical protein
VECVNRHKQVEELAAQQSHFEQLARAAAHQASDGSTTSGDELSPRSTSRLLRTRLLVRSLAAERGMRLPSPRRRNNNNNSSSSASGGDARVGLRGLHSRWQVSVDGVDVCMRTHAGCIASACDHRRRATRA